jgi:alpha-ketoglutarate-dependent taurine dioxygenase
MNKPVRSQPGRPITVERGGITVTRVGVHLGAEIGGVDLRKPLSDAAFETIQDALVDNELIIFRNQEISSDNLINFGRRFGELTVHPFAHTTRKRLSSSNSETTKPIRPSPRTSGIRMKHSAASRRLRRSCAPRWCRQLAATPCSRACQQRSRV